MNLFTVLNGLKILNALNPASPDIFVPFIAYSKIKDIQPIITTKKSKIFHASLI